MAVNAGLINAQIPMSTKAFTPDIAGSIEQGYTMRGNIQKEQQQEQAFSRENSDRDVLQGYLKQGGDIYTPKGAEKALTDLKGKVSSDLYMKLGSHANDLKDKDIEYRKSVAGLQEKELQIHNQQMDKTLGYLAEPLRVYSETVATKGEQEAQARFNEARDKALAAAAAEKGEGGKPIYPPEMLQKFAQATPETLRPLMAGTSYRKAVIEERLKESQISRNEGLQKFDEARAEATRSGRLGAGGMDFIQKTTRDVELKLITPEQGEAMIKGFIAKQSKPSESVSLDPDALRRAGVEHYMSGTLPSRMTPQERVAILNESAKYAREVGDSAEEEVVNRQLRKAATGSNADLTKRMNLTEAFSKDSEKRLLFVQDLAHKADQSGVPVLNRWLNAGRTNIEGDTDVNNFNSAMISLQAELARVLSGALTNAGTSDAARAEAGQIINKFMSPEMIDALVPNIQKELKFKKDSWAEQIAENQKMMGVQKKTPLPEPGAAPGAAPRSAESRIRDNIVDPGDRIKILNDELKLEKGRLEASKDPESQARHKEAIAGIEREIAASQPKPAGGAKKNLPPKNKQGWILHKDAQGHQAYVSPDGKQFEEVK